jgi:hypothetical protein
MEEERTLVNTTRVQDDLSLDRSNFRVLRVARQPDSKQLGWRVFRPCDSPSHTRARYNHSTIYALESSALSKTDPPILSKSFLATFPLKILFPEGRSCNVLLRNVTDRFVDAERPDPRFEGDFRSPGPAVIAKNPNSTRRIDRESFAAVE